MARLVLGYEMTMIRVKKSGERGIVLETEANRRRVKLLYGNDDSYVCWLRAEELEFLPDHAKDDATKIFEEQFTREGG